MAKAIRIYTIRPCSFSSEALKLLEELGVDFENVDLSDAPYERSKLIQQTGRRTFPQVFVEQRCIGGYTTLADLIDGGEFQAMIADES
ncbi:MAG: glutaredoxin domain-containing protein [Myxococcota bacterium]|nr:glutaredoxin domain-containing protein [Myxococcota bacterium]